MGFYDEMAAMAAMLSPGHIGGKAAILSGNHRFTPDPLRVPRRINYGQDMGSQPMPADWRVEPHGVNVPVSDIIDHYNLLLRKYGNSGPGYYMSDRYHDMWMPAIKRYFNTHPTRASDAAQPIGNFIDPYYHRSSF